MSKTSCAFSPGHAYPPNRERTSIRVGYLTFSRRPVTQHTSSCTLKLGVSPQPLALTIKPIHMLDSCQAAWSRSRAVPSSNSSTYRTTNSAGLLLHLRGSRRWTDFTYRTTNFQAISIRSRAARHLVIWLRLGLGLELLYRVVFIRLTRELTPTPTPTRCCMASVTDRFSNLGTHQSVGRLIP